MNFFIISKSVVSLKEDLITGVNRRCMSSWTGSFPKISNLQVALNNSAGFYYAVLNGHSLGKITDNDTIKYVTGERYASSGMVNGALENARFGSISSYYQINSTFILVVDAGNHCLRSIDLDVGLVQTYSGFCSEDRDYTGQDPEDEGTRIRYIFPYHFAPDPTNSTALYLTDKNAVRQIDINSKYVSIHFQLTSASRSDFSAAVGNIRLLWMAFTKQSIFITSSSSDLIVLNTDWSVNQIIKPEELGASVKRVEHVFAYSPDIIFLTFTTDLGWYESDPHMLVYQMQNSEANFVIDEISPVKETLAASLQSVRFISWTDNKLIYSGEPSRTLNDCKAIIQVTLKGKIS